MRQQPSSWILAALKPSTYLKPYASLAVALLEERVHHPSE
jgi:hypothetical protein